MKNTLNIAILLCISLVAKAQSWNLSTVQPFAYGCPGTICIGGPTTGYTFESVPPAQVTNIPGWCGDVELLGWAGTYTVIIRNASNGNIVQTFPNIVLAQPPCMLELINLSVVSGCYNDNEIWFYNNGLFCGGGNVDLYKDGFYQTTMPFNAPGGPFYFSNLTPGNYQLTISSFTCTDTKSITIPANCNAPSSGFVATNITSSSAKLNWTTIPCALKYTISYRKKNTSSWTTVYVNSNSSFKSITGLLPSTIYQWRIKSRCNLNPISASTWSPIQSFTTAPLRIGQDVTETEPTLVLSVYPNPASETFKIESPFDLTNTNISISDVNGRVLNSSVQIDENMAEINLQNFDNGIYTVIVKTENNIYKNKVVVLK
ncbi:MAG: T9SS type A sorting domain-containing protein [Bacteroidetes bacterium]|nr:T9SS type A sorting domain-containing protein [Bacteroidota bacterium]